MITQAQYVGIWAGHENWTPDCQRESVILLSRVNPLIADYEASTGKVVKTNTYTKSQISGAKYGGFRPLDCPYGALLSSHKEGKAVDVFDPDEDFDDWLTEHPEKLVEYDLYREHPSKTKKWCHLSTRKPPSGKRTFLP